MGKLPQYLKEGWGPRGPGKCRCPDCGASVSTNALARATHKRLACKPVSKPQPKKES